MSKRSYHFGPMDPSSKPMEQSPSKKRALNLLEAIRQDFERDIGVLRRNGDGFLYEFGEDQVYYSPNCNRPDVRVPSKIPTSTSSDAGTSRVATASSGVLLGHDFEIEEFMQPQWWTASQGYFAFTPRMLDTTTPSFRHLRRTPPVHYADRSRNYYVDRLLLGPWKTLEDDIRSAIGHLRSFVALSMVLPLPPCAQIDATTFKSKREALMKVDRAHGWFKVWAGALGYSIAVFTAVSSKARNLQLQNTVPAWIDVLLNPEGSVQPLDDVFVSDVSRVVARYDGSIARVGAFVELPETPNEYMVSIDWLLSVNVPVWWAWGPREERITAKYPVFDRYRPPVAAKRVFGGSMPTNVELPMNLDPTSDDLPPLIPQSSDGGPSRSRFERRPIPTDAQLQIWNHTRKLRRDNREKRIATETEQQRQRRLAVEAQPPTRINKVRFWVWKLDPGTNVYVPDRADKDEALQMFSSESDYSRQQAEYDYFGCHWHVADFLGVPEDVQLARMAEETAEFWATPYDLEYLRLRVWYGLADVPLETPIQMKERLSVEKASVGCGGETAAMDDGVSATIHEHSRPDAEEGAHEEAIPDTQEDQGFQQDTMPFEAHQARTETTAYLLCGYLAPEPLPCDDDPPLGTACALVAKLIGQFKSLPVGHRYWSTDSGKSLARFGVVVSRGSPSDDGDSRLWDLSLSSRNPVVKRPCFQLLRKIQGQIKIAGTKWDNLKGAIPITANVQSCHMLFDALSDRGWYLGTTSPAVALHICRMDDALSPIGVAYDLLSRGFRVQTLHRLPSSWRSPIEFQHPSSSISPLARFRRCGHTWSQRDYDSWMASVKIFMRSSRGRAAILRGGIIWRITVQLLLPELVLFGPSLRAMHGEGLVIEDDAGCVFVDDELTGEEVDLICGVHYVYVESEPKKPRSSSTSMGNLPKGFRDLEVPKEQLRRVSFFPPEDLWLARFGTAAGWSEDADYWHRRLEDKFRNGVFEPMTRKEWRQALKSHSLNQLDDTSSAAITQALAQVPASAHPTSDSTNSS